MRLDAWLKHAGDLGAWSNRQPLEPFPSFRNRCVAAGWEYVEQYTLHQLRRGVPVPERLYWFRTIDEGWAEPTGMVHVIVPRQERSTHPPVFHLDYSLDASERCRHLEAQGDHPLEVFQQWPGSKALVATLRRALHSSRTNGEWYRWIQEDVMQLVMAMDVVTNAWAHRRYWFGLNAP